jgi:hypothetical protein
LSCPAYSKQIYLCRNFVKALFSILFRPWTTQGSGEPGQYKEMPQGEGIRLGYFFENQDFTSHPDYCRLYAVKCTVFITFSVLLRVFDYILLRVIVTVIKYFLRSEKKVGYHFFGFVYAKNDLILCSFIFREMALSCLAYFFHLLQSLFVKWISFIYLIQLVHTKGKSFSYIFL